MTAGRCRHSRALLLLQRQRQQQLLASLYHRQLSSGLMPWCRKWQQPRTWEMHAAVQASSCKPLSSLSQQGAKARCVHGIQPRCGWAPAYVWPLHQLRRRAVIGISCERAYMITTNRADRIVLAVAAGWSSAQQLLLQGTCRTGAQQPVSSGARAQVNLAVYLLVACGICTSFVCLLPANPS